MSINSYLLPSMDRIVCLNMDSISLSSSHSWSTLRSTQLNLVLISSKYIQQNVTHSVAMYAFAINPSNCALLRTYFFKIHKNLKIKINFNLTNIFISYNWYDKKIMISLSFNRIHPSIMYWSGQKSFFWKMNNQMHHSIKNDDENIFFNL